MSNKLVKGIIKEVYEREWTDPKSGEDIVLHSFQFDGDNRYYRTGRSPVGFKAGESIKCLADGRGNVDLDSVETIAAEEAPAPKARGNTGSRTQSARTQGGGSRNDYWEKKAERDIAITEPRISYSAAQKNATTLVAAALAADALSFGQAAKGKKLDMLVDYVEQVTLDLARLQMDAPNLMKEETE